MELQVHNCVKVYEVFCHIGKQFDELDMDEFIRDKSALAQTIKHKSIEETILEEQKQNEEEEDMNAVKALPPPPPPQGGFKYHFKLLQSVRLRDKHLQTLQHH